MNELYLLVASISCLLFFAYVLWLDHKEKLARHGSKLPTIDFETQLTVEMPMGQEPETFSVVSMDLMKQLNEPTTLKITMVKSSEHNLKIQEN